MKVNHHLLPRLLLQSNLHKSIIHVWAHDNLTYYKLAYTNHIKVIHRTSKIHKTKIRTTYNGKPFLNILIKFIVLI